MSQHTGGGPAAAGNAKLPCLVTNPRSFRAGWMGLAQRCAAMARAAGLPVHEVVDPASLTRLLDQLRAQQQQQIWMLAGDGTIQALADYFAARQPDDWQPALLFLAGGRANIVPRERGGYPALPAMRRALAAVAAGRELQLESIRTLCITQEGRPDRHGFLFAGAVVYEAVRLCAENRAAGTGWRHRSFFADPLVLLRLGFRSLLGRSPLPPGASLSVRLAGIGELAAPLRVLVASSIPLAAALYNPFADRGTGPVRLTAIAASAARFWRNLPGVVKGRFDDSMNVAGGYLSGRGEAALIGGMSRYALDGELFDVDPMKPLHILPGITLRVLRA